MIRPRKRGFTGFSPHDTEGIAKVTRIRLNRNLQGEKFPGWATAAERQRVQNRIEKAASVAIPNMIFPHDAVLDQFYSELREADVKSSGEPDGRYRAVGFIPDKNIYLHINDVEHIRLEIYVEDLKDLEKGWETLNQLDSALERELEYAWSPQYGYLTASVTEVGTGLQVSTIFQLVALSLLNEDDRVVTGMHRLNFTPENMLVGDFNFVKQLQFTNRLTLGMDEEEIISRCKRIYKKLTEVEADALCKLFANSPGILLDYICRAIAILKSAWLIPTVESMQLLNAVQFGLDHDLVSGISPKRLHEVFMICQSNAFLQHYVMAEEPVENDPDVIDEERARFLHYEMEKLTCCFSNIR
ncbi:MAG: hypothetical protein IJR99_00980 [Kiritimatiellae bacterium]|nr:hypothetical protein [Kiritimatiellia bacterium]